MESKNKIIILALIVVIAALLIGIFATMPQTPNKQDTNLTFKCKSTINEGDSIKIQLTDANGTAIANQSVNVTITDKNKASDYHSVVTNNKGVGTLNIDKSAGEYVITVKYNGNDNYTGCNATKKITIEEKDVPQESSSSQQSSYEESSSSSNNGIHYDAEINVYYNDEGIVVDPDGHHQMEVGNKYEVLRERRDKWERGELVM